MNQSIYVSRSRYQQGLGKLIVNKPKSRDALVRDSIEYRQTREGMRKASVDVNMASYSLLPMIKGGRDLLS